MEIQDLRKKLLHGMSLEKLLEYKEELNSEKEFLLSRKVLTDKEFHQLHDLLMIYLDYYVYSDIDEELISDHNYDLLMNHYIKNGGKLLSKADKIKSLTQWEFVRHEYPGMVGTVKKAYELEELAIYLNKYRSKLGYRKFRLAPKFDGISSAIKISSSGKVLLGVTRNDGIEGQDITQVIRNASNIEELTSYYAIKLLKEGGEFCWVKTELVVTTDNFNKLIEEKQYMNRRSATSGIVNSPKNLGLAKYITIVPLAAHFVSSDRVEYEPMGYKDVKINNAYELMDDCMKMLSVIRDASYPIRTDGVVIYPLGDDILPNFDDIMDDAIAFKVNTEEGLTKVKYGYVSVGRLGYAIPMLKVIPVEVNETIVQDVSLGSFDKFVNMDLHEDEQVLIYSAGDVIPQAKLPEERNYPKKSPLLKIKKVCPYCGEKLSRYTEGTYRCENEDCIRIKSGKITNFLIKMKVEDVSDRTIDDLIEFKLIEDIPDIFEVSVNQIAEIPGYGETKAKNIVNEFDKIRENETPVSALLGALGIDGISEKKCQKLFKLMTLKEMFKIGRDQLPYELVSADNTGFKTAEVFTRFIFDNKSLIKKLMSIMNIVTDKEWKGNVVFTGFRNPELEKTFNSLGYEVSNNVNGKTIVVVDASYNHDSTKCKTALRKGIDVVHVSEVNDVLNAIKKGMK